MRLYVLLIAHMLADFTLQTNEMAEKKKTERKFLWRHCEIYAVVMAVGCFSCMGIASAFGMIVLLGITHCLIDWARTKNEPRYANDGIKALGSFLIDQVLHIGIILFACWLLRNQKLEGWLVSLTKNAELKRFLREILWEGCTMDQLLRYSLLFVMIMDPASVLIKKLSEVVSAKKIVESKPDPKNTKSKRDAQEENHAGSLIGKLERLIIVMLVMYDGYGGVGLVLAAKSMARHDKLKDQEFAESYLVGTLSSTAIAMLLAQWLG